MFAWFRQLIHDNGVLHGRLERGGAENERLKAQCDFLAARVTILETERAMLLERLLGIQMPVPTYAREETPPKTPDRLTPDALAALPPRGAPMPEGARGRVFTAPAEPTAEDRLADAQALFEDVGDERARELGIQHTPDGTVRYQ